MIDTEVQEKMLAIADGNPGTLDVLRDLVEVPEFIDYLHKYAPGGSAVRDLYHRWCKDDISTFVRVVGVLMADQQPEVFLALRAEIEARQFTDAWENAHET